MRACPPSAAVDPLPEHIADLIRQGRKIEAIKLIREETGVDLVQAKQAVDRLSASEAFEDLPSGLLETDAPDADVEALARQGRKIEAIKALRERTGLSLAEAKAQVEQIPGVPASSARLVLVILAALLAMAVGLAAAVFFALAEGG